MGKEYNMSKTNKVISELETMPRYLTRKPEFSCPLSPYILWNKGLRYATCPIGERERDMRECENCVNKGSSTAKTKSGKKRVRRKKNDVKIEKKELSPIPKIGKTYVSK